MIGAIVHQLTRNMTPEQIKKAGYEAYFVDHTAGVYPTAEQKARVTYDNILRLCDDPDVSDIIRFLREREVIHYQRFGEALRIASEKLDQKNVYAINPAFDK